MESEAIMGRLIYLFASYAARHENGATSLDGMRLLADTLHPHGVKITWIVGRESARIAADCLARWHADQEDDIAVHMPPLSGTLKDKQAQVSAERKAVLQALPW
ncbi:MAG TPA: hypothetical protein PKO36_17620, partial [Candidatus Hydrogenedentes bacterium]|nr:hypothetical protein [Candidatus Hydrogenedentota bacterium]